MLKTFFVSIFSIAATLCVNLRAGASIPVKGKRAFYFASASSNCRIVELCEEKAKDFIYFKPALKGESVTLFSPQDKEAILKKYSAKEVFSEKTGDIVNRYYFSPKISSYIEVNGEKANLHISESNGVITVGIPFIFGSY